MIEYLLYKFSVSSSGDWNKQSLLRWLSKIFVGNLCSTSFCLSLIYKSQLLFVIHLTLTGHILIDGRINSVVSIHDPHQGTSYSRVAGLLVHTNEGDRSSDSMSRYYLRIFEM